MLPIKSDTEQLIYYVTFEEYLRPKKTQQLQIFTGQTKLQNQGKHANTESEKKLTQATKHECTKVADEYRKVLKFAKRWQLNTRNERRNRCLGCITFKNLPSCLSFLRARNDDGLCKRKSGFEIYCEMASIHGFINFVDAKTWQRIFWCSVVCLAILLSFGILIMWHLLNIETPTILYTEHTTYPAWTIPFPAVVVCNLNRISKRRALDLAQRFYEHSNSSLTQQQILQHFPLALYNSDQVSGTPAEYSVLQGLLEHNNYTMHKLLNDISPDCKSELVRCRWKGQIQRCDKLFHRIETTRGLCCAFNYHALKESVYQSKLTRDLEEPQHTTSRSFEMGLSVLLDPSLDDYMASSRKTTGYRLLIHESYDFPAHSMEELHIQSRTETTMAITPSTTYATKYVYDECLESRRCYFPHERQLNNFRTYTQTNCLSECRSSLFYDKCACVPPYMPRANSSWPICGLAEAACVVAENDLHSRTLMEEDAWPLKGKRYGEERIICDCFPSCNFNHYSNVLDSGILNRTYSLGEKRFFKDINVTNHILLHVFYGDLTAERLRLDVYENWVSFVGTFGGIAGLHMGYSFVSGFEVIFFAIVRPACNWITKRQIRYRVNRKARKAAAAAAKREQQAQKAKQAP